MMKRLFVKGGKRSMAVLIVLMASTMMLMAQEMNEKFSMTTQMFLNGLKEATEQPTAGPHHAPQRPSFGKTGLKKARRLIASPDTVGGVAYISCFIHMKDVNDLGSVQALGVEVEETFDGLDFVTARVPVEKLNQLADVDNVTKIKVAQQMRPLTDAARQKTNVDDLLTQSPDAIAAGVTTKYDGSGVVLGIIDTGIDFQHIAFKDKNGNSRIKRAYVQTGAYTSSGTEYTESNISSATTDDNTEDHGTHTATTAGGSSVKINGTSVTVTDDHSQATYGGMAPGADLYLAGIKGLYDTGLTAALNKMVTYANNQGKPLVVSNSWGSGWGPRDGTGEFSSLVGQYFGDSHPNRVILFASSNDAGHSKDNEGGGYFVKKSSASSSSPLGTIIRSASYSNTDAGYMYQGLIACAWSSSRLNCKIHVLNSSTGAILKSWTVTQNNTGSFSGLDSYYDGSMIVYIEQDNGKYRLAVYSEEGIETTSSSGSNYYKSNYTLAIEVYPSSGNADINMWAGDYSYFTNHLSTSGHTWSEGTDDMCVSDEATIPNSISVGAYVSKTSQKNYQGSNYSYSSGTLGDIADFSSYATASQSPTGVAYPWITAPGAQLVAGVNHYHTASIDEYSYFHSDNKSSLVVNNSSNPYAVMQGTSMATPVAAGIVALWLQASMEENATHKNLTVNDVKNIMEATAINDSYTTTGANASHFGKGKIDALAGIQYILGSSSSPLIKADPTSIDFADKNPFATRSYTKTLNVQGMNLEGDITATLTDANGVYSLSQTSITQSAAANGVDITITYAPQAAGTHNATITLTSNNATTVEVPLTATAQAAVPTIIADPETLTFTAGLNEQKSLTFDVLSEFLTDNVTVSLSDANHVFSIDKTSITKADSEEGATVTVTFQSATAGTFNGTVTLSSAGAESVTISLTGKISSSNPNTTTFKLVTSTDDLEEGMRYIIGCGSKSTAAGALSSSYLEKQDITVSDDVITIGNGVAVFVLEGNQTDGWTFKNESTNTYLYSSAAKSVGYSNTANTWTLSNGTNGVIMTYSTSSYGSMQYNSSSPRFTTYTSSQTEANLYMEYSDGGTTTTTPELIADPETLSFEAEANETQVKTFNILGADLTGNVTVSLSGATSVFSVSPATITKADAEEGATVSVTFSPTDAGTFSGIVTLTSAGAESVTVSLTGTATASATQTSGNDFTLVTSASDFVEGDYIIVYDGGAMNTTVSNNRLQYTEVTPSNNVITTDNAAIIWHIAPSGNYYTIYNAVEQKYAASTGTKNQAQLLASGTDDKSLWSVTTGATFDFVNKHNSANSVNSNLRRNSTYGFACYATGTGGALSLYKRTGTSTELLDNAITGINDTYTIDLANSESQIDLSGATATNGTVQFEVTNSTVPTANYTLTNGVLTVSHNGIITIRAYVNADSEYKAAEKTVTVTVIDNPVIAYAGETETTAYGTAYTVDEDMIEGGAITLTSGNTAVATVEGLTITPVAVGTTTITINTAVTDIYHAGTATFTLTVTAPKGLTTALPSTSGLLFGESFGDNSGSARAWDDSYSVKSGVAAVYSDITYTITNAKQSKNTMGQTASALVSSSGGVGCFIVGPFKVTAYTNLNVSNYFGMSSGSWNNSSYMKLSYSVGGTDYTEVSRTDSNTPSGAVNANKNYVQTSYSLPSDAESDNLYLKFEFYCYQVNKNSQEIGQAYFDEVQLNGDTKGSLTVKLNASGYATYCSQYPLDFTNVDDYSAWQITAVSGETITFSQVTGAVKGGTGLLLKGEAGETITLTSSDSNNELDGNLLYGTLAPTYVETGQYYGLSGNQFKKVNPGTVPAGKALLPASVLSQNSSIPSRLTFVFEDDTTTGVEELKNSSIEELNSVYDLQGRKIENRKSANRKLHQGLYIINGKKVVFK